MIKFGRVKDVEYSGGDIPGWVGWSARRIRREMDVFVDDECIGYIYEDEGGGSPLCFCSSREQRGDGDAEFEFGLHDAGWPADFGEARVMARRALERSSVAAGVES